MVWSGHKRKREHGVAILMAPHVKIEDYKEHHQARIMSATIEVRGMRLSILNAYAPTDASKSEATKAAFYNSLNKAVVHLEKTPKYKLITLGDFNATISSKSKESGVWDDILGCNNSDRVETNENGDRFLKWCLRNKMKIMNSIFRTKRIHRETWRHAATGTWKRIDYICTTNWVSKFVKSCRAYTKASAPFDTDHRLLVMNISFPSSKRELRMKLSRHSAKEPTSKIDFKALKEDPNLQELLTSKTDRDLENIDTGNMDDLNELIVSTVVKNMEEICPSIEPAKKREPWEDDVLKQQMKDLYNCSTHKELRKSQKTIKERRTHLKNEYYRELADGINNAAEARNVEKEFSLAKKYTAIKAGSKLRISNEKLKNHFEKHFTARGATDTT